MISFSDVSKTILEQLEGAKAQSGDYNFGFIYISHHLAEDATSIYNLFRSVLGIDHWVGANGASVCGVGEAFMDKPSIAVMVGRYAEDEFCVLAPDHEGVVPWLEKRDPMLGIVHVNPFSSEDVSHDIRALYDMSGGFLVGGLVPSHKAPVTIADGCHEEGVSGVLFSQNISVASTVSQGCQPIGETHTVTKAYEQTVYEINGVPAVDVFEDDLRYHISHHIGKDPSTYLQEQKVEGGADVPEEFHELFQGEIHAAFQVPARDQQDYTVRDILEINQEEGTINVSHHVSTGERVLFVQRGANAMRSDLATKLLDLRKRIEKQTGSFVPKGALYISCGARAVMNDDPDNNGEMGLIRDIIGDVPLAGFYAGGEISNGQLYKYTGVLTLFL